MKPRNDETRKLILATAKQEFLDLGFRHASLRIIAKRLNATTGIIYTYFKNKNEIFAILIKPVTNEFERRLDTKELSINEAIEETDMIPKSWFTKNLKFLIGLIENYPDEMKLLFLKSDGSQFETYKERLMSKGMERSLAIFRTLKRSKDFEGQELSEFFVFNLVSYVINIVIEILKQDKNKKEIAYYENEITSFLFSGWKALVDF
jgi:AcrR family transcriptional regulator